VIRGHRPRLGLRGGLVAPGFEAEDLAAMDREAALEDGGEDGRLVQLAQAAQAALRRLRTDGTRPTVSRGATRTWIG
jgi:hypothetical protein